MQDTIIKGTGNSRTLGSVPNFLTLYPTYEAFGQALINKQLPIDLGPLNPAGVQTAGTDLNKGNLLKDATAALYGLSAAAVPDQVLAMARNLISAAQNTANGRVQIAMGSYVGTGVRSTEANPLVLTFPFSPALVFVAYNNEIQPRTPSDGTGRYSYYYQLWMRQHNSKDAIAVSTPGNYLFKAEITFNENLVSRIATKYGTVTIPDVSYNRAEMNEANIQYSYIAIG